MENNVVEKFENFLRSFGASRLLLQRANENGFLIEGSVLYASLIDGLCRLSLILREQIDKKSRDINEKYIYQNAEESTFSERSIYKKVLDKKIISKELFKELNFLYDIRNKIIHRFFLSEIEYSHFEVLCQRYEHIFEKLTKTIYDLETEQIKQGVGMTVQEPTDSKAIKHDVGLQIAKKIKSRSEINLAKTLNCVSVEEIVEFASKEGLLIKCKCGHSKMMHVDNKNFSKSSYSDIKELLTKCSGKGCSCQKFVPKEK